MKEIIVDSERYGIVKSQVDDKDYEWLKKFNWNVSEDKGNLYLAARSVDKSDKKRKFKIHQLIKMPYPSGFVIDHKNGNTLDNTRDNLRLATIQQNTHNRKPLKNKKSIYKGVSFQRKWTCQITINGKRIFGGSFINEIEAAQKWNEMARQYHGEFAYQNPV